jgi:hypothetical protein
MVEGDNKREKNEAILTQYYCQQQSTHSHVVYMAIERLSKWNPVTHVYGSQT